jgi:hypothetical protein
MTRELLHDSSQVNRTDLQLVTPAVRTRVMGLEAKDPKCKLASSLIVVTVAELPQRTKGSSRIHNDSLLLLLE